MGPEQWLFLQWHEHKGSLISTFEKLFERNTFVDCTLAAEGQYLNVHKMILSACSPYFEILLNENRDKHPIIILKDVKFRSLKSIIEYMYRGEANVLSTEIKDFLSAAETLQIKGLGKQGGGDTKNAPPKELRDFMEADSLTTGSQVISHDSGEKEMWRNPDLASVLTETSCESATQNNTAFSQGDHLPTKKIAPQRIAVPVMRVEEENESKWPKMEDNDEPRKCLKAVMPTLNLGTHAMEPVHHATVDKVLDLNVCSTSNQSVPSTNDAQMSIELTRKNELEPEPQQAHGTRETEEVETASVASSAIEVSDTTEEWAEEDIEEGPTPSQATGHSAAAGTDESHPLFDASNMTRDSVSRNIANDHQDSETNVENAVIRASCKLQLAVKSLEYHIQESDSTDLHQKKNAVQNVASQVQPNKISRTLLHSIPSLNIHESTELNPLQKPNRISFSNPSLSSTLESRPSTYCISRSIRKPDFLPYVCPDFPSDKSTKTQKTPDEQFCPRPPTDYFTRSDISFDPISTPDFYPDSLDDLSCSVIDTSYGKTYSIPKNKTQRVSGQRRQNETSISSCFGSNDNRHWNPTPCSYSNKQENTISNIQPNPFKHYPPKVEVNLQLNSHSSTHTNHLPCEYTHSNTNSNCRDDPHYLPYYQHHYPYHLQHKSRRHHRHSPRYPPILSPPGPNPEATECMQKSFPWVSYIKKHMKPTKSEKFYHCKECDFVTENFSELIAHQRLHSVVFERGSHANQRRGKMDSNAQLASSSKDRAYKM